MPKSSHSKQREPGLQGPMRPITGVITMEDGITVSTTQANWTTAAQLLNVAVDTIYFDDKSRVSVTAGDDISLPPGVWEVDLHPTFVNGSAGDRDAEVAVTNEGGTTIYGSSPVSILNANQDQQVRVVAQFHLTTQTTIQLRARTDGATVTINDESYIGVFRKIGNVNET